MLSLFKVALSGSEMKSVQFGISMVVIGTQICQKLEDLDQFALWRENYFNLAYK